MSSGRQARRSFTLTLTTDLRDALTKFMEAEQYDSESLAVQALVRIAFAATPQEAIDVSTRSHAYNEVRQKTMRMAARSFHEIAAFLELV